MVVALAGIVLAASYALKDHTPIVPLPPPSTHADFELIDVTVNGRKFNVDSQEVVLLPKSTELKIVLRFRNLAARMIEKTGIFYLIRMEPPNQLVVLTGSLTEEFRRIGKETIVAGQLSVPAENENGEALLRFHAPKIVYADILVDIVEPKD